MAKRERKPQAQKGRNEGYMRGMQELRRSSAAGPHKSGKDYKRKDKYGRVWE